MAWVPILRALLPFLEGIITKLAWPIFIGLGIKTVFTGTPDVGVSKLSEAVKAGAAAGIQNTASAATGGLIQAAGAVPIPGAAVPEVNSTDRAIAAFTNPWLYVGVGAALLAFTAVTKQTRGLARDVGGGIATTRKSVRADLDDVVGDPS